MPKSTWTLDELKKLHELRENGFSFNEIAKKMKRSAGSITTKWRRTEWDKFFDDPDAYVAAGQQCRVSAWTNTEMAQLDAYLQSGKSYEFVANKLGRSIISVERKAQTTDWKAWRAIDYSAKVEEVEPSEEDQKAFLTQLVNAILTICRYSHERLNLIKEPEFLKQVNLEREKMGLNFSQLKVHAAEELNRLGFGNPESLDLEEGTYIIVGDSHGKHTKKSMFALLRQINKHLKPKKIIHVGHILDDDNDISYDWGDFKNLVILAKKEELKFIQDQRNKFNFSFDIIQENINLGRDLIVWNQDLISDYVKSPIRNLDAEIFDQKVIVNCHRQELYPRCSNDGVSYFVSPGCICERHIIRTIKQMDFTDGKVVKQAYWHGFSKYRKWTHMNRYWETGLLVVQVDDEGDHTITPCAIKPLSNGFATSYFDKIISSKGVFKPDKKIFINGDMHCAKHDGSVLDIQENICKDYKPDVYVNLGDTMNFSSLNHHVMDRGGVILNEQLTLESAQTHFVLKRAAKWAKKCHIIYGNHERFAADFTEKYPQLANMIDFKFLCDVEALGYEVTDLKGVLKIVSTTIIHGEMRMFGQKGTKIEKVFHTFGRDTFLGHIHCPMIRFGAYSIGLTGMLDQEYNEPDASQWIHGFGMCNQYKGKSWPTTIAIINNKCILSGKKYLPINPDSWKLSRYDVKLQFDVA